MKLDLRLPIGLMFAIFGAMLTVYGLVSGDAIYARSLGINVKQLFRKFIRCNEMILSPFFVK